MYKDNKMKIIKISIFRPYEQMLFKTFYFAAQTFVDLINIIMSLHEMFYNFWGCLSAQIK